MLKITGSLAIAVCLLAAGVDFREPEPLLVKYPEYFGNRINIPRNNPITEQGVALGRMLFYETALSANNSISCGTCHRQELAFTDGKRFSEGFDGIPQPRNTMSLANLLWVRNFFWDGRASSLEKQALIPLTGPHEMGQSLEASAKKLQSKAGYVRHFKTAFGSDSITGERMVMALAQFERTLVSSNSRYDQFLQGTYTPTQSERNGIALFYGNPSPANNVRGANCSHCHGGAKTYSELFHNNGLDSVPVDPGRKSITNQALDDGRFRVVTLRNIALTAPYMHDGRFATLEQVVEHYNEHIVKTKALSSFLLNASNTSNGQQLDLTKEEQKDLIAFLRMLTDSSFISDKRFSNPFPK